MCSARVGIQLITETLTSPIGCSEHIKVRIWITFTLSIVLVPESFAISAEGKFCKRVFLPLLLPSEIQRAFVIPGSVDFRV
jgi:hypothetical protein